MTNNFDKTMQRGWYQYNCLKYTYDDIYKAYKKPSGYKVRAYEHIKESMMEDEGYGLRIWGANCQAFSAGYVYMNDEKQLIFKYFTKDYTRTCIIPEGV